MVGMDVFKITPCSRKDNRYDIVVNGSYDTFVDTVSEKDEVDVLSQTPVLTILEYGERRYAIEKNRDRENRFTVTVTADNKSDAVDRLHALPTPGLDLKE